MSSMVKAVLQRLGCPIHQLVVKGQNWIEKLLSIAVRSD